MPFGYNVGYYIDPGWGSETIDGYVEGGGSNNGTPINGCGGIALGRPPLGKTHLRHAEGRVIPNLRSL